MKPSVDTEIVDCPGCGASAGRVIARSRDFEFATCDNEFAFVRCTCGWVYLRNQPLPSELGRIYPPEYAPYDYESYLRPTVRRLRDWVLARKVRRLARLAPGAGLVVDVGCGSGDLLRKLLRFGPADWQLLGIDISEEAVAALRRDGIAARVGRFEDLDWEGAAARLVIMDQVIEHLTMPRRALARAYEILTPGGCLVVETPSLDGWDAKWFRRRYWGGWHAPRHFTLFDRATLEGALRDAGFEVIETTHMFSPNCWLLSVHHWILERLRAPRLARLVDWRFPPSLVLACALDSLQLLVHGSTSNLRMVGCKGCVSPKRSFPPPQK